MDIANAALKGDTTFEKDGLKLFLEPKANDMLMTTIIDFSDGQGFILSGMQPKSSCGSSCSSC